MTILCRNFTDHTQEDHYCRPVLKELFLGGILADIWLRRSRYGGQAWVAATLFLRVYYSNLFKNCTLYNKEWTFPYIAKQTHRTYLLVLIHIDVTYDWWKDRPGIAILVVWDSSTSSFTNNDYACLYKSISSTSIKNFNLLDSDGTRVVQGKSGD